MPSAAGALCYCLAFALATVCMAALLCSCSSSETYKPVPRREAYPRISQYPPQYAAIDSIPLNIEANTHARVEIDHKADGPIWLTICYPAYGAQALYTLTPTRAHAMAEVIDNRMQRISLNLNGAPYTESRECSIGDYAASIIEAPSAQSTPLQFIAAPQHLDADGWVVSGAVYFPNAKADASIDSIAPMLQVLRRDLDHALRNLK